MQALQQIWMMDSKGVVYNERGDELPKHKKVVARTDGPDVPHTKDLKEVVAHVKPHALVGLTGRGPAFTEVSIQHRPLMGILCLLEMQLPQHKMCHLMGKISNWLTRVLTRLSCRAIVSTAEKPGIRRVAGGHSFPIDS